MAKGSPRKGNKPKGQSRSQKEEALSMPKSINESGAGATTEEVELKSPQFLRYLTNRGNLIEILTSGLMKPPRAYSKYYPDSNADCPDALIFWQHDPGEGLVKDLSASNPSMFPVLLDIDMADTSKVVARIRADYDVTNGDRAKADDRGLAFAGVLPAARIRAIHFRNEDEYLEFTSRGYLNLREGAYRFLVSPVRFRGPHVNIEKLKDVAAGICSFIGSDTLKGLQNVEARGGALLLMAHLAGQELATARQKTQEEKLPSQDWGARVFDLMFEATAASTPDSFYNAELLERVRRALATELDVAGDSGEAGRDYLKLMDTLKDVLENKVDIDVFPSDAPWPLNALLQFSIHSDPETLLRASVDDAAQAPGWLIDAAAWAGALHKHARIPIALRPKEITERLISQWEAERVNVPTTSAAPETSKEIHAGLTLTLRSILQQAGEEEFRAARSAASEKSEEISGAKKTRATATRISKGAGQAKAPPKVASDSGLLTRGILWGNLKGVQVEAETTRYAGPGLNSIAGNENIVRMVMPFECVIRNFFVRTASAQPASGGLVLTIRKNDTSTALSLTIRPGAITGRYAVNEKRIGFAAGDEFSISLKNEAKSPSAGIWGWSVDYEVK